MGILTDALVIVIGALLGSRMGAKKRSSADLHILGIGIIIVSLVGFFENIFSVDETGISAVDLTVVLFAYMIGSKLGEALHLEDAFSNFGKTDNAKLNALIDSFLFFGVGGMQICGPIELALGGDNTQLYLKTAVDIPFALVFGSTYGGFAALSALPVALVQILIAVLAYFSSSFFSERMIAQICAMGYVILFFSGYNLLSDGKHKISNINMMPSLLLVIFFNLLKELFV